MRNRRCLVALAQVARLVLTVAPASMFDCTVRADINELYLTQNLLHSIDYSVFVVYTFVCFLFLYTIVD